MNRRMEEKKKEIVEKEGFPQCEGIREVLEKLHQEGYLLAVGSSSPEDVIRKVLKDLDLAQYFSAFISGENMTHPKPAPDTFLAAAEALLLDPSACMVVEDSTNGGKAAKAAGMSCVWFHNPDSGDQQIPDFFLGSFQCRENYESIRTMRKKRNSHASILEKRSRWKCVQQLLIRQKIFIWDGRWIMNSPMEMRLQ